MSEQRYILDSDDDGHWYVVEAEQYDAFNDAVDSDPESIEGLPGVHRLPGAPTNIDFTDPRDENGERIGS